MLYEKEAYNTSLGINLNLISSNFTGVIFPLLNIKGVTSNLGNRISYIIFFMSEY